MDRDAHEHGHSGSPGRMMVESPATVPWVYAACGILGLWLVVSPATFRYEGALAASDVVSGAAVAFLSLGAALAGRRRAWVLFLVSGVGLWILFAPLVFWSTSAAAYANGTLIGALLIAFSLIVPMGMPMGGPDVPAGWTYNPSSWAQRTPIIVLGLIGFFISRYLTAYHLGHIDTIWDPFFGDGTRRVLESEVSRAFPISDAGLGAVAYLLEVLSGFMGDRRRWRTMPWMVAMFGVLVVPLGAVSIVLIMMQPVAVGAWCTLCLVSAAAMAVMIPLTLDEVVAMVQFLRQEKAAGRSVWSAFWAGGQQQGATESVDSGRAGWRPAEMVRGVRWFAPMLLSAAIGAWLVVSASLLALPKAAADHAYVVGSLAVVASVAALAEVGRPARFVNVALGLWIAVMPWLLAVPVGGAVHESAAGLALVLLALPAGARREAYGAANRIAFWSPTRRSA